MAEPGEAVGVIAAQSMGASAKGIRHSAWPNDKMMVDSRWDYIWLVIWVDMVDHVVDYVVDWLIYAKLC